MRVAIATVLVAFAVVLAGCPGTDGSGGAEPAADQEDEAGTINDNDAGAEPVNPQNGTDAEGNESDEAIAGANESGNDSAVDTGNTTGADAGGNGT